MAEHPTPTTSDADGMPRVVTPRPEEASAVLDLADRAGAADGHPPLSDQTRVLLAWDRLIMPDGRSIVLERQPGADGAGFAGLQDRVNQHWGNLLRAAAVSTLLGVGTELGADSQDDLTRALRRGSQDTINQTGQQIVRRQLNVQPTLTIRPGHPLRVVLTRDLVLEPIGGTR